MTQTTVQADLELSAHALDSIPKPGDTFGSCGRIVDFSHDPGYQRATMKMRVEYVIRDFDGEILAALYDELESVPAVERYRLEVVRETGRGYLQNVQIWQHQAMPSGTIASLSAPVIKGVTS